VLALCSIFVASSIDAKRYAVTVRIRVPDFLIAGNSIHYTMLQEEVKLEATLSLINARGKTRRTYVVIDMATSQSEAAHQYRLVT